MAITVAWNLVVFSEPEKNWPAMQLGRIHKTDTMANFLLLRETHPTKQVRSTIPTSSFKMF